MTQVRLDDILATHLSIIPVRIKYFLRALQVIHPAFDLVENLRPALEMICRNPLPRLIAKGIADGLPVLARVHIDQGRNHLPDCYSVNIGELHDFRLIRLLIADAVAAGGRITRAEINAERPLRRLQFLKFQFSFHCIVF